MGLARHAGPVCPPLSRPPHCALPSPFFHGRQNYFKEKSYFSMEPLTKKALKTMIRLVKENSITVQMHTMGPQVGTARCLLLLAA